MSPIIKLLILVGVIYFLTRRLLKPFRDYQRQVKQQGNQAAKHKQETTTKTDGLGDYIDYEEIEK